MEAIGRLPVMPMTLGLPIAALFVIAAGLAARGLLDMGGKPTKAVFSITMCVEALLFAAIIMHMALVSVAMSHGMTDDEFMKSSYEDLFRGIENSPKESRLPDDLHGKIVIYYQFGCKDCQAIYKDLHAALEGRPEVYFVAARSDQGRELLERYPVRSVPSGIYVMLENEAAENSQYETVDFAAYELYRTDGDGNSVLDAYNLNKLFEWQENGL